MFDTMSNVANLNNFHARNIYAKMQRNTHAKQQRIYITLFLQPGLKTLRLSSFAALRGKISLLQTKTI